MPLVAALFLSGCGGSGGDATPSGQESELTSGELTVRGKSLTRLQTSAGAFASVVGMAGDLSLVRMRDLTPTFEESTIVFTNDLTRIRAMDGDGRNVRDVATGTYVRSLDFNSTGTRIYFADLGLKYVANTGGAITPVTPDARFSALSPDGTTLAFSWDLGGTLIKTVSTSGTNLTTVGTFSGDTFGLDWLDNEWIVYCSGGQMHKVRKNGADDQPLYIPGAQTYFHPRVSPDKRQLAVVGTMSDSTNHIFVVTLSEYGLSEARSYPTSERATGLAWSPDSQEFIAGFGSGRIVRMNSGGSEILLDPIAPGNYQSCMDMSPAPTERLLVGTTGGLYGGKAAGFLVSQTGPRTRACVAWDATTPSTSTLTFEKDASNESTLVYRIEADALTKLSYTQNNSFKFVSALGAGTVNGAIVSLDGNWGSALTVISYNETRSGGKPKITRSGSSAIVSGSELTVFDVKTGKTTHGLTRVELP
ncbi:MAG: TolB family protein [Fimbriimonas sp.]